MARELTVSSASTGVRLEPELFCRPLPQSGGAISFLELIHVQKLPLQLVYGD